MNTQTSYPAESEWRQAIHPGEILLERLSRVGVSVAALSRAIKVEEHRLAELVKGEMAITADLALLLAQYFGDSAQSWLNHQVAFDQASGRAEREPSVLNAACAA